METEAAKEYVDNIMSSQTLVKTCQPSDMKEAEDGYYSQTFVKSNQAVSQTGGLHGGKSRKRNRSDTDICAYEIDHGSELSVKKQKQYNFAYAYARRMLYGETPMKNGNSKNLENHDPSLPSQQVIAP